MKKICLITCFLFLIGVVVSNGQYTVMHNFMGTDGEAPHGALIRSGGVLYGMTYEGGTYGGGVIFSINTNGSNYTDLYNLGANFSGDGPYGTLAMEGNKLFGLTYNGGTNNNGAVFSINTNGTGYRNLTSFAFTGGAYESMGSIVVVNGVLYGCGTKGGLNNDGTIFSLDTNGSNYHDLLDFNYTNGRYPEGSLRVTGNMMYGTTYDGGTNGDGNIFSITTTGGSFTNIFGSLAYPEEGGALLQIGSTLFGTDELNSPGNVYKILTNGGSYKVLHTFNTSQGAFPTCDLTQSGGLLFGMTQTGGLYSNGIIFCVDTNGNNFKDLFDFNGTNGSSPYNDVIISGDTLFGMTADGGTNLYGVVFSDIVCTVYATVITATNETCHGGNTASATVTAGGGVSPYTYLWSNGTSTVSTANPTGNILSAGSYTVTVTDHGGCTATETVTISQPGAISVTIASHTNLTCNGGTNGSITANAATGGVSPYTYSWSPNGGTNLTASNLTAGTYTITATDNHGCTGTASATITQPASAIGITIASQNNAFCNGGVGNVTANAATGGTSPYIYSWTPSGGTNLTASNLSAGTYTVTATDNHGCTATASVTITQPANALAITIASHTNPICNGGVGNATANAATGGTSPYTYSWSPSGGTNLSASNLSAGTYTITVTDANSCTATALVTITQPAAVAITIASFNNVPCHGGTGNATANAATGGSSPYTYSWTPSGGTNLTASNLSAGTYTITAKDVHSCSATASVTITQPAFAIAITISSHTNVLCHGGSTGSATANAATGGTSPYTYNWTPNGGTNLTASSLSAGTYTITAKDANSCSASVSVTITQPAALAVTISSHTSVLCHGGSTGSVTANAATGGTSPYTYNWTPNGGTNLTASNLTAGVYTITATDNHGCTGTAAFNITQPNTSLGITMSTHTNVLCNGGTGSATAHAATGGTSPYTYSWAPSGGTNLTASNLTAGTYTVTATDNHGCTATVSVTITQPATAPVITIASHNNVLCNGGTGNATANAATGGASPYTYSWTPSGGTSLAASNLSAGTYTITATDNHGCVATASVTITQPASALGITIASETSIPCYGGTGNATANPAIGGTAGSGLISTVAGNGTAGYNGDFITATSAEINQPTGVYVDNSGNIFITENQNQRIRKVNTSGIISTIAGNGIVGFTGDGGAATSAELNQPYGNCTDALGNIYIADTYNNRIRKVNTSGIISTVAGNGTAGYNGDVIAATSAELNLPTGVYVDASGNIFIADYFNNRVRKVSTSGIITTVAGTGTAGYNGDGIPATSAELNNLEGVFLDAAGNIFIGDANNNRIRKVNTTGIISTVAGTGTAGYNGDGITATSAELHGPETVSIDGFGNIYVTDLSNQRIRMVNTSGIISTVAGNGTAGYNGDGIAATSAELNYPRYVYPDGTGNIFIADQNNARVRKVAGASYNYLWTPSGGTNLAASNLSAGTYTITATDNHGCAATASVNITQPASALGITIASQNNPICNGGTGSVTANAATGGTSPYTYSWTPSGGSNSTASNLSAGTYTITTTDANSCTASASVTITQPASGVAITIASYTNVLCNGGTGSVTANAATGGTSPYTYVWSPSGGSNLTASSLSTGTYTIAATDANGCTGTASANITQPGAIRDSITGVTNANCANNGIATLGVKYGTSPYTYLWTPGGYTTATVTSLGAQTYTATVTDNHGCTGAARNVIISNSGSSLRDSISVIGHVGCNGGNGGVISIGTRGGYTPFTYSWSNGATLYTVSNLTAGTYSVTVRDNHGCTNSLTATITQPTALVATQATITYPECHGGKGTASVNASGGTTNYSYAWSPSVSTSSSSTNLTAGTYTVTVSDAHGCKSSVTVVMTQPNAIRDTVIASTKVNVSCNGLSNGSATIGIKYGTSPYTYLWSNGQTNANVTGLSAGVYSLTVTDINGCSGTVSMTITQPAATLSAAFGTITCTSNLVTVSVTAAGGTSPYIYLWSPGGGTKATMSNLTPGTYTVSVSDAHGCNTTITENLVCPPEIKKEPEGHAPPECCGGLDNITLYPNPNTGQFTLTGLEVGMNIEIFDYTGRKVYSQLNIQKSTFNINIADQPNGVYLIRIMDKDGTVVAQKKVAKTQ